MTTVQRVAQIFGIAFLLAALAGFFAPGGMAMHTDPPAHALGMFPVNLLHNIVHLLFGAWGLAASRSWDGAVSYAKITGALYIVLAILGFVAPDGFGLIPMGGNDIWLHAVIGVVLAYFGFTAKGGTAPVAA